MTHTGRTKMTSTKTTAARTSRAKNVAPVTTPTIVLKTVHDAIIRDNPTATITTKKMRVALRASPVMRPIHVRNSSWIFTPAQADAVRAMFDPAFALKIERAAKRVTKAPKIKATPVVPAPDAPAVAD